MRHPFAGHACSPATFFQAFSPKKPAGCAAADRVSALDIEKSTKIVGQDSASCVFYPNAKNVSLKYICTPLHNTHMYDLYIYMCVCVSVPHVHDKLGGKGQTWIKPQARLDRHSLLRFAPPPRDPPPNPQRPQKTPKSPEQTNPRPPVGSGPPLPASWAVSESIRSNQSGRRLLNRWFPMLLGLQIQLQTTNPNQLGFTSNSVAQRTQN